MNEKMIRGVLVGTTFPLILGSLLACSREKTTDPGTSGSPGASSASSQAAPVTLKGMLFNEAPKDLPIILEEFEKRTKDKLNTKLNIGVEYAGRSQAKGQTEDGDRGIG